MKKLPEPTEYDQQCSIFRFAEQMSTQYPELEMLVGSMNGVRLTIGQAVKAKKAGMKKGYPDILLPVKREPYSGLYIELKRDKKSKVSVEQLWWLEQLRKQGFYATVCYGEDEVKDLLIKYLGEV